MQQSYLEMPLKKVYNGKAHLFFISFITLLTVCVVQDGLFGNQFANLNSIRSGFQQQDSAIEDLRLDVVSVLRHGNAIRAILLRQRIGDALATETNFVGSGYAPWNWPTRVIYTFLFRLTPF